MTYIKLFEDMFSDPQEDDYIICNKDIYGPDIIDFFGVEKGFFINNIGKIYGIRNNNTYYVEYENDKNYIIHIDDIAYFSDDKNKVKAYRDQNKYNL